jgi:RecA-family ATPase
MPDIDAELLELEIPIEDADVIKQRSVKEEWLVANFLPEKTLTVISAQRGAMKTYFAYGLSVAVASGESFLGLPTKQRTVLYFDRDNPEVVINKRLRMMGSPEGFKLWCKNLPEHAKYPPPPVDTAKGQLRYAHLIKKYQPNPLLIFDVFQEFYSSGKDKNKDVDMMPVVDAYIRLVQLGCTIVYLHHRVIHSIKNQADASPKGKGSSVIEEKPDNSFIISPDKVKGNIFLENTKCRLDIIPRRKIRMQEDHFAGGWSWIDVSEGDE